MLHYRVLNKTDPEIAFIRNAKARFSRLVFSKNELEQLYHTATAESDKSLPFHEIYRCKPASYFRDIRQNQNGIMKTYIKDDMGIAANAINGIISGLFFMVRPINFGELPDTSPFGDKMLILEADRFLNPIWHKYCSATLKLLNPENNDLLRVQELFQGGMNQPTTSPRQFSYSTNANLWVEICVTEDVDLKEYLTKDLEEVPGRWKTIQHIVPDPARPGLGNGQQRAEDRVPYYDKQK